MILDAYFCQISDENGNHLCDLENLYSPGEIELNAYSDNWFNITANDRIFRKEKGAMVWKITVPGNHSKLWWFRFYAKKFIKAQKDGIFTKSAYSKITNGLPENLFDNYFISDVVPVKENRIERYLPEINRINDITNRDFRALELEEYFEDKTNKWYFFEAIALMDITPLVKQDLHPSIVWVNLDNGLKDYGTNQVTIMLKVLNDKAAKELIEKEGIVSFVNTVKVAWDKHSITDKQPIINEAYKVLGNAIGCHIEKKDLNFNYHLVIPKEQLPQSSNNDDINWGLLGSLLGGCC